MALKPNKELLCKTLRYIEKHRSEWKQSKYRCRTGTCFAGHAAILGGSEWAIPEDPNSIWVARLGNRPREYVWLRARKLLRLSGKQAVDLFYSMNTLTDLRRIVRELCQ